MIKLFATASFERPFLTTPNNAESALLSVMSMRQYVRLRRVEREVTALCLGSKNRGGPAVLSPLVDGA